MHPIHCLRALALLTATLWLAPHVAAQKLNIGFRAVPQLNGLLNSEDSRNEDVNYVLTPGLSAGVAVGYQLNKKWGFEVNVLYALQGQEYQLRYRGTGFLGDTIGTGTFEKFRRRINQVKVPMMVMYTFASEKGPALRVYAGPQLSLLLSANEYYRDNTIDDINHVGIRYAGTGLTAGDNYRGIEWGLVAGFRVDFPITKKLSLNTGIRGEYGITDIEDKTTAWRNPVTLDPLPTNYFENYYGAGRARTAATRQYVIGFTFGVTFTIDFNRDPNDYYW